MIEEDRALNSINITPLVDVSLVLLLIFMVTTPMSLIHGINVKSQSLEKYGLSTPQENIVVSLTGHGVFVKDDKGVNRPIPYKEFGGILSDMIQLSVSKRVLLHVDSEVPHGQTVWVLDIAKQNGAQDLSFYEGGS